MEKYEEKPGVENEALLCDHQTVANDAGPDAVPADRDPRNARGLRGVVYRLGRSRLPACYIVMIVSISQFIFRFAGLGAKSADAALTIYFGLTICWILAVMKAGLENDALW